MLVKQLIIQTALNQTAFLIFFFYEDKREYKRVLEGIGIRAILRGGERYDNMRRGAGRGNK